MSHRYQEKESVQTLQAVTDAEGIATLTFEGVPHGWYYLTATANDSRGRTVTRDRYLCIYDPSANSWWWWGNDNEKISILPDKESYAPGETAHLLIQSRFQSGTGLLTLEREGVYEEFIINLDGPVTMVDLPITESYGPNIFAKFHFFQKAADSGEGLGQVGNREGNLVTAETEIEVELLGKKLAVDIAMDAPQYRPGQSAQVTLTLQDSAGEPTAGRISVALVDEALFALQEDLSADLFATFYNPGENRVGTYHSLIHNPYWYWYMELGLSEGCSNCIVLSPTSGESPILESPEESQESAPPITSQLGASRLGPSPRILASAQPQNSY